jgi:hypothetical protein
MISIVTCVMTDLFNYFKLLLTPFYFLKRVFHYVLFIYLLFFQLWLNPFLILIVTGSLYVGGLSLLILMI